MSFIKRKITDAIVKKVGDAAMDAAVLSLANHLESTHSVDAIVGKSTSRYLLFIKRKGTSPKRKFIVSDDTDVSKYFIRTDSLTFGYPCIRLYDAEENHIGKVECTSKTGMGTYAIYLDDKCLGSISRKLSVKIRFDLDFNGWHLAGDLMQSNFVVTDQNGNSVVKFCSAVSGRDTYVLEMNNREYEILGLLLVMTIEAMLHGED